MSLPTSLAAFKAAHSNMSSNPVASTTSPSTSGNYGETFLATIGTDVVPVPIQTIASINAAAYLKNASFQSLSQAAYSLLSTYGVNNVMMFVGQQLPINHSMALTEAANVRSSIHSHLFATDNLVAIAFVNKNWKKIQTSFSEDLDERTEGLYGVSFRCVLYGPQIDPRIRDDRELVAEFVLKLPQQLYDSEAKAVTDLSSPVAKRSTFSTPIRPKPFQLIYSMLRKGNKITTI